MSHLTVILKPTNRCNAGCVYCSNWQASQKHKTMSMEILEKIFQRIEEWVIFSKRARHIKIIWHGGEPTLMPVPFFEKVISLEEKLIDTHGLHLENNLQSNLLFLKDEKLDVLERLLTFRGQKQTIGTSFDPLPGIRTIGRGDYNKIWFDSIKVLEEKGFPYGIVYVVHQGTLDNLDTVVDTFTTQFPRTGIRFNPLYKEGRAGIDECRPLYISASQWGDFLIRLYRKWEELDKAPSWQPLREMEEFHTGKSSRLCCDYSGKCGTSHLGIDADGSIYCCGRGIDRKYKSYGNVFDNTIPQILSSAARKEMINRSAYLEKTHCLDCKWWRYCHGGCPMDSAISHNDDIFHKTNFCAARQKFLSAIYNEPNASGGPPGALRGPLRGERQGARHAGGSKAPPGPP